MIDTGRSLLVVIFDEGGLLWLFDKISKVPEFHTINEIVV